MTDFSQRRRVDAGQAPRQAGRGTQLGSPVLKDLRRPRHTGIFQAVHRLDTTIDQAQRAQLARWIRDQYEREYGDIPLGFLAPCYLGPPYIDHRLDLIQSIVEHYAPADAVPEPFSGARMLVRTGAYVFIEVYASGDLRPVRDDGSVVA